MQKHWGDEHVLYSVPIIRIQFSWPLLTFIQYNLCKFNVAQHKQRATDLQSTSKTHVIWLLIPLIWNSKTVSTKHRRPLVVNVVYPWNFNRAMLNSHYEIYFFMSDRMPFPNADVTFCKLLQLCLILFLKHYRCKPVRDICWSAQILDFQSLVSCDLDVNLKLASCVSVCCRRPWWGCTYKDQRRHRSWAHGCRRCFSRKANHINLYTVIMVSINSVRCNISQYFW